MPSVNKAAREYVNTDDPGFPFNGPGLNNGGSTNIINEGGDDTHGISLAAVAGIVIGLLFSLGILLFLICWSLRRRKKAGTGDHGLEMGTAPGWTHTSHGPQGGHHSAAGSEVGL